MVFLDRFLGGSTPDVFHLSKGRLLIVEARREGLELTYDVPKAVSQAIAMLKTTKYVTVALLLPSYLS